jgi:microcin C transport system permease protein
LPLIATTIGGFASLTFFCKNSFIEEINKQYVLSAYAKGLNQNQVLYKHVFRNAMLIIIAGLPAALIGIFFTSTVLIEIIFSLDGLGLLGYEATLSRDYPVMFATLYIFTLLGLITNIISDFTYVIVDPRIDFNKINAS